MMGSTDEDISTMASLNFLLLIVLGFKVITSDVLVYLDFFTMIYLTVLAKIQMYRINNENTSSS